MWSLIVAIVIGFIAGLIARAIHPGDDKAGFIVTTLLGIAGSLVATYGGRLLGLYCYFIHLQHGHQKNLNSAIKKSTVSGAFYLYL